MGFMCSVQNKKVFLQFIKAFLISIIPYFSEIIQRSRSLTKLFLMRVQMRVMTMNGFLRFRQKHKGINFISFI
jgi:hypothetical protein